MWENMYYCNLLKTFKNSNYNFSNENKNNIKMYKIKKLEIELN